MREAIPAVQELAALARVLIRGTVVAIDISGKWWTGSEPADVAEYLRAYTAGQDILMGLPGRPTAAGAIP